MLTSTALTRRRRQIYRRIWATVTARRISAATQSDTATEEDTSSTSQA